MPFYRLVPLLAVLLFSGTASAQDSAIAAERMILIPMAPGGPSDSMPFYKPEELGEAKFGVFLDPELRGQDVDAYLEQRSALATATFELLIYSLAPDYTEADPLGTPVVAMAGGPDTLTFDPDQFADGRWAWAVRATIARPDGRLATVSSSPLFLRIGASDTQLKGLTGSLSSGSTAILSRMEADQRRSGTAMSCALRGLKLYATYPTSSSSYVSVPVLPGVHSPWPEQPDARVLQLAELKRIGELEQRVLALRERLKQSGVARDELAEIVAAVRDLVSSPALTGQTKLTASLAGICDRLLLVGSASTGDLLSLVSELLIALDSLLGYGTVDLQMDYQAAFRAYAGRSDARLQNLEAIVGNAETLLGAPGVEDLMLLIEEQRGRLLLLREEVGRGRLARGQLSQRMEEYLIEYRNSVLPKYKMIEGASCLPNANRTRRLTAADAEQIHTYQIELLQCESLRLLEALWDIH